MSGDAWLTLAVLGIMLVVLVSGRVSPVVAVLGATVALLVADVTTPQQAFSGFANPAPITVGALYVLARAVEKTGALEWLTSWILPAAPRAGVSVRRQLGRFLPTPLVSSAVLNNTTVVAMLSPRVLAWARRTGRPVSKFLMPLSFAAVLGGLLTVIGTSTNLVVSGLLEAAGEDAIGLFEITKAGLPIVAVGLIVLLLVAPWTLPERRAPGAPTEESAREFTVEMRVDRRSPLVGRTVAGAGLRNLEGVYLVEIERSGRTVAPVSPDEELREGDHLTFAGNVARVVDLQQMPGLVPAEEHHFQVVGDRRRTFYEMVVASNSSLVGTTLKESGFRDRFSGAVVAIHRAGERVPGKLGSVTLRSGDVLLVLSDTNLHHRVRDHRDFLVVARLDEGAPPRREHARLVEAAIVAFLVVVGVGWLDVLEASLLLGFGLVATRVLAPGEARDAVDLDVVVLIAAAFGIGEAMTVSGLAGEMAEGLVNAFGGWGDVGLLAGVLVATIVLTELITNNAAAVLMFPIAVATATGAGLDPRPFAIAVAIGASASFLTPIGYQTNTMVYGMGGYRFSDFARLGVFLTVVVVAVSLVVIPIAWPLEG